MVSPFIKICGVRTTEMAREAVRAGAHFIGIVFHPQSRRYVPVEQAALIARAVHEQGGVPVAVFVNHTAEHMQTILDATPIQVVQLHGPIARQQHDRLPSHYQRIYVRSVAPNGVVETDAPQRCDPLRDYVLFDNAEPGIGEPFNWAGFNDNEGSAIGSASVVRSCELRSTSRTTDAEPIAEPYHGLFRLGLAGGLTPENVAMAIKLIQPALVDVSSGVENAFGEKDIARIKQFIRACKQGGTP